MKLNLLGNRVLVIPINAESKTAGGIIIPDAAKEKPLKGSIVAVGPGTKDEPMILKENDVILYDKYSGQEIEFEGIKYLLINQSDIIATIE